MRTENRKLAAENAKSAKTCGQESQASADSAFFAAKNKGGDGFATKARIYYRDIGDYLSREKKLEIVRDMRSMLDPKMNLVEITPNEKNDWINQRDGLFDSLIPMEPKKKYDREAQSVFLVNSRGLETARDAWLYSFSLDELKKNIGRMIEFYNSQLGKPKDDLDYDPTKISWSSNLISAAGKSEKISTLFHLKLFYKYLQNNILYH